MDRTRNAGNAQARRAALALFSAAIFSWPLLCAAQGSPNAAPPRAPAQGPITELLQPSLETVRQTLQALRLDKWKKGSVRDEAGGNIDSILRDLRINLPPLLQTADAAPGAVSKLLPLSTHVGALYDVLLRVVEASRVAAPDDQAAQLQQTLLKLSNARLILDDRMRGSADALEKQVIDLRATIQKQAAQRPVAPAPVALPCVPPPPHKTTTRKHKPAAKPTPKPSGTTTQGKTPNTTTGTQPSTSH